MKKRNILLTNDDGIRSPGLWAAAAALSELGYVTVAAPREQSSGAGRSMPNSSDGRIQPQSLDVGGQDWTVFAVGGTPAQAVLHAVLEIMPNRPDLVVSGINYGENVSIGVTVSGTVGAALEGAALGIPSLAVSLETDRAHYFSYSNEVDFSAAAFFTARFARCLLEKQFPPDVDLLKVEVPSQATRQTPWQLTRLSRSAYFTPTVPERTSWEQDGSVGFEVRSSFGGEPEGSDVHALRVKKAVSVTPLSLDLTSRADFGSLEGLIRSVTG